MPLPVLPDQIASELKTLVPLASLIKAAPPIVNRRRLRHASTERREAAYVKLQRAVIDCQMYVIWLITLQPHYGGLGRPLYFPHLLRTLDGFRNASREVLGALIEVRMVGLPEVRTVAEQLVARTSSLQEGIPTAHRGTRRKDQMAKFDDLAQALGAAHRDFTLVARRDLGYDRKLRRRWWEFWRPRSDPAWPGGWPVIMPDEDKQLPA